MGEIICSNCGYMNSHVYCHARLKCERCGQPITYCTSCNSPINPNQFLIWEVILRKTRQMKKEIAEGI